MLVFRKGRDLSFTQDATLAAPNLDMLDGCHSRVKIRRPLAGSAGTTSDNASLC